MQQGCDFQAITLGLGQELFTDLNTEIRNAMTMLGRSGIAKR